MLVQLITLGGLCRSKVMTHPNRPGDLIRVAIAPRLTGDFFQRGEVSVTICTVGSITFAWTGKTKRFKKYAELVYIYERED